MTNIQKVSQYFFIIAAVIAILDGAFTLDTTMTTLKVMFLLIAGVIVGILRHDQKEKEFLLASVAVIFTGLIFTNLMGSYPLLENFSRMIDNFIVFLATAVIVVGIEIIAEIIAMPHEKKEIKKLKDMSEEEIKKMNFQKIWGTVILVAVALTFILLLAESFFNVGRFQDIITILDGAITVLFIVDLVILYHDSKDFKSFLKHNVFDIIASIPLVGVLRGLKLIRAIKIIKVMKGTTKATKLSKLYKTTKFFSEESYFNKVNDGTLDTPKKKSAKKTASKKKSSKPKSKTAKNKKK